MWQRRIALALPTLRIHHRAVVGLPDALTTLTILGAASPLVSACIMIFPLVVVKSPSELSTVPLDVPICAREVPSREEHSHEHASAALLEPQLFAVTFFPAMNRAWHRTFHMSAVSVGVLLGCVSADGECEGAP